MNPKIITFSLLLCFLAGFQVSGLAEPATIEEKQVTSQAMAEKKAKLKQDLISWIDAQRQATGTPGLAVLLIQGQDILIQEGFGHRDREKKLPVTPQTLFAIGSTTKAFTSTLLAKQVEKGLLQWDHPLRSYLPDFSLQDPVASAQMTPRDLLLHHSGLPRHDLLWYGQTGSRDSYYQKLKYLPPSAEFRQRFQYQNLMYLTAGILAEKVGGKSWETLIKQEILTPLGMSQTLSSGPLARQTVDHALPYGRRNKIIQTLPFRDIQALAPAGGLYSNLEDMAQWLHFQWGRGKGKNLLSANSLKELHTPQVVMQGQGQGEIPYLLYGLGWMIHPYRGETVIQHAGNIDGFSALVAFLPERQIGMVILSNLDNDALPTLTLFHCLDQLLEKPPLAWEERLEKMMAFLNLDQPPPPDQQLQIKHTRPSHSLGAYQGKFEHPAYGSLHIQEEWGKLKLNFGSFSAPLAHWHYETFLAQETNSLLHGLKVQFMTNLAGQVEAVEIQLESALPPLRFQRQALALSSEALQDFVGTYLVGQMPIQVMQRGEQLVSQALGQPPYLLEALEPDYFRIQNLPGYYIRFQRQGDKVVGALVIQPSGNYSAPKLKN